MDQEIVNQRTGLGVVIGAGLGFMFGGPLGAALGGLVGGGVAHTTEQKPAGVMTAKRRIIYQRAMEKISEPSELRTLADAFEKEGLSAEALMLRKRAALRELPESTQALRRKHFRQAMASDNLEMIQRLSQAFASVGSVDAAKALADHAEAVKAAHAAGKSAQPMPAGSQENFANKLGHAIVHFGPDSDQARAAAGNLIQARGKTASSALITQVIRIASVAVKRPLPETTDTSADAPAVAPSDGEAPVIDASPEAVAGANIPSSPMDDEPEPTVVGAQRGPIEPPAIEPGAPPPAATEGAAA